MFIIVFTTAGHWILSWDIFIKLQFHACWVHSHSGTKKIVSIVRNPKIPFRFEQNPPLITVLTQPHPIHTLPSSPATVFGEPAMHRILTCLVSYKFIFLCSDRPKEHSPVATFNVAELSTPDPTLSCTTTHYKRSACIWSTYLQVPSISAGNFLLPQPERRVMLWWQRAK
jgi:hypothetical protein